MKYIFFFLVFFFAQVMIGQGISKLYWNDLPPELFQKKVLLQQTDNLLQEAADFHPEILYLSLLRVNHMYNQSEDKDKINLLLKEYRVKLEWEKVRFLKRQLTYIEKFDIPVERKEPAIDYLLDFIDDDAIDPNSKPTEIPNSNIMNYVITKYYLSDTTMNFSPEIDYSFLRDSIETNMINNMGNKLMKEDPDLTQIDEIGQLVEYWYMFDNDEFAPRFYPLFVKVVNIYGSIQNLSGFDLQLGFVYRAQENEIIVEGSHIPDSKLSNIETSHPLFMIGINYRHNLKTRKKPLSNVTFNLNFGLSLGGQLESTTESFSNYQSDSPYYGTLETYYLGDTDNEFPGVIMYEVKYSMSLSLFTGTPVWWVTQDLAIEALLGIDYTAITYQNTYHYRYTLERYVHGTWTTVGTYEAGPGDDSNVIRSMQVIPALGLRYTDSDKWFLNVRIGYKYGDFSFGFSI